MSWCVWLYLRKFVFFKIGIQYYRNKQKINIIDYIFGGKEMININSRDRFLEKRKQLMEQCFIEDEYKKRHFLINNSLEKYKDIIDFLERKINGAVGSEFLYLGDFEGDVITYKHSQNFDSMPFCNEDTPFYRKLITLEFETRKNYNIPFYNLIMPADCVETAQKIKQGSFIATPIIKQFMEKKDFLLGLVYRVVFSYCLTEYRFEGVDEVEKDFLIQEFAKALNNEADIDKIALITLLSKCSNGSDLNDSDFDILTKEISNHLVDDFRSNSLERRVRGLLYYDFHIAANARPIKCRIDDFIMYLNVSQQMDYPRFKNEPLKRELRDDLRIASICISENKIYPTTKKGDTQFPPSINFSDHIPFYHEFAKFQQEQHDKRNPKKV